MMWLGYSVKAINNSHADWDLEGQKLPISEVMFALNSSDYIHSLSKTLLFMYGNCFSTLRRLER